MTKKITKKTTKKAARKAAPKVGPYIFAERQPKRSEMDDYERVNVWDGRMWESKSVAKMDERDIWHPAFKRPTQKVLARSIEIDERPPNPLG